MGKHFDEIISLMRQRRTQDAALIQAMIENRDRYNGTVVVPMPDVSSLPVANRPGPNFFQESVDGHARLANAMLPKIDCPTRNPGSERSEKLASLRQGMLYGMWYESQLQLKLGRSYRQLAAYGTHAMVVVPDDHLGRPDIQIRDALTCVDPSTEILTKRGWLRYDELELDDEVAGYDVDTQSSRWTNLDKVNIFDYDGDMVTVERRGLSMFLTPDHRCVVDYRQSRDVNRASGDVHIVNARDLKRGHYIPRSSTWDEYGEKSIGVDLAALCGWVAAEGNYNGKYKYVYLSQSQSWNPEHVAEIDALLSRLPNFPINREGRHTVRRSVKELWRHERHRNGKIEVEWRLPLGLGQEIQRLMPDKLLGPWCLELPPDERRALLHAFIDGDGAPNGRNGWQIFQKLRQNLDILQMIAVTLGYKSNLSPSADGSKWVLYVQNSRKFVSLNGRAERDRQEIPREHYRGVVWCPTTGTGTWFARRNGSVFITGNCYPELRSPDDIRPPKDCGFLFARSAQWLVEHYPDTVPNFLAQTVDKGWDTLWDVVEWIDEDDIVIGVMGPRFPAYGYADARPYGYNAIELGRWPNKAGMVPVVAPRRTTLDMVMGQLTAMINYSDLFGRMLSLQLVATEKAIFPDLAILSRTGDVPTLVGGTWKDGRTGDVNLITNAAVEMIGKEPGPGTIPVLQMIDQHIRGGTGAAPMFAGNNAGMRTGAGVDALGDFAVNPMVAESQSIMERSLVEVNKAVIAVAKGYYGNKTFTFPLGLSGSRKTVTLTPEKDLDSDLNVVTYIAPGADINRYAVALTQLNATGIISRKTARDKHPMVDDAAEEEQFVALEKLNDATLAAAANEIAQGSPTMSTAVVARAAQHVASGMSMYEAFLHAQAEAATQAPAPGAQGGPPATGPGGQPIPPGLAQMLAAQGAGPQAGPGNPIQSAPPGLMNLRHVLQGVNENISPGAV